MQNNHYQVYLKSVFDLAASVVIKCHENAKLLNTYIDTFIGPNLYDEFDPRTWRYYLNLCGEYHNTDQVMTVTSIDTQEVIVFNKENLRFHKATAKGYAFGTKQYRELVNRYPKQVQLIHGVLYPAEMETLIAQEDYTLASYAPEFVLSQETQLIPQLKEWLSGYFARTLIGGFIRSDELFLAAVFGDLADHLVPQILLLRAKAMKTRFAHDYHIHQHLSSHSSVGQYLPMMTKSQAMFAYRNICYIERHSGSGENFEWLIDNIMTPQGLPIADFESRQNTLLMPEELAPEPVFFKRSLNTIGNVDGINTYSLSQLLTLQDKIVAGNAEYRDETERANLDAIQYSKHNQSPTKVLESTVIDYTDSERTRWSDIAVNHWLSLSQKDYYTAFINFEIPSSGETITISVKDAFALYIYCLVTGVNETISHLPLVNALAVVRTPHPTVEDLKKLTSRVATKDLEILHGLVPRARRSISVEDFYTLTRELFVAANRQWSEVSGEEHLDVRGQKEAAAFHMWGMEFHDLADYEGQSYAEWFRERNLKFDDYRREELAEVANIILSKATGVEFNDAISLKSIQRAMVDMLTGLSSYSIQIGASINTGPVIYAGILQLRFGDFFGEVSGLHKLIAANVRLSNLKGEESHLVGLDIMENALDDKSTYYVGNSNYLNLASLTDVCDVSDGNTGIRSPMSLNTGVGFSYPDLEPLPEFAKDEINIPGMAHWYSLTEEQRASRKQPYKVELS